MSAEAKAEAPGPSLGPRTAEVLRSLDRAKVTIAKTQTSPNIEAMAESLESAVVAVAGREARRLPARPGPRR
jgi:hypothetical protein